MILSRDPCAVQQVLISYFVYSNVFIRLPFSNSQLWTFIPWPHVQGSLVRLMGCTWGPLSAFVRGSVAEFWHLLKGNLHQEGGDQMPSVMKLPAPRSWQWI